MRKFFFVEVLKYSDSNERVFFFFVYRDKNGNSNTVKVRKTFAASVWELLEFYIMIVINYYT